MPKPIYIVCSESGAHDRMTNSVSLFNLVDRIKIRRIEPPEGKVLIVSKDSLHVTALWMAEAEEIGKEFEFEVVALFPPNDAETPFMKGKFKFDGQYHRILTRVNGQLPFEGPGLMRVQNRVRATGSSEWISQECPIVIEEMVPEPVTS